MRIRTAAIALAIAALASGGAQATTASPNVERINTLIFSTPLPIFLDIARRPTAADRSFDWSSDLCSAPLIGSTGRTFDFRGPCRRHDFAYRNFKAADSTSSCRVPPTGGSCVVVRVPSGRWWNATVRQRVDRQFLTDMLMHCSTRSGTAKFKCQGWAHVFYRSVRVAGGP